jgi:hypothetical protein
MFNKICLKRLQEVQARIKDCKTRIKELDPPEPKNFKIGSNVCQWINSLTNRTKPSVDLLYHCSDHEEKVATNDYLRQLGEYFINIADYNSKKDKYQLELALLLREEIDLKEKLGIE